MVRWETTQQYGTVYHAVAPSESEDNFSAGFESPNQNLDAPLGTVSYI